MEQAAALGIFGALRRMTEVFSGWLPILALVSLIAGVWLYYLLVARHEPQHHTLAACLRVFLRFEALLWPIVGRVLYLSISVFLLLSGLMTTFFVNFFGGLVGTVLLLLIVRILFEMSMMLFGIHEKLMQMQPPADPAQCRDESTGEKTGRRTPARAGKPSVPVEPATRKKHHERVREQELAADLSLFPDEDELDAQDGLVPRRKPAFTAESLPQKASAEADLDLPLFSAKRVDKTEPPVVK